MAYDFLISVSKRSKIIFISLIVIASILVYITNTWFLQLEFLRPIRPSDFSNVVEDKKLEKNFKDVITSDAKSLNNLEIKDRWGVFDFDPQKNHSFVMLHIQKTGGTNLEKRLIQEVLNHSCSCKTPRLSCDCRRSKGDKEVWLICRYTKIGKSKAWPCGTHPDWTELKDCIPKLTIQYTGVNPYRNFFYLTQLRDPVRRFFSEFLHVRRGATWEGSNHFCKGKRPPKSQISCYQGDNWMNVSLKEFLNCEKNLAINRQTRMLSNLELVDCYNLSAMAKTKRDTIILESAMDNLKSISYFSLMEYPSESQFLFEKTFNLKFEKPWTLLDKGYASIHMKEVSENDLKLLERVNYLDVKLYKFAKKLFFRRLKHVMKLSGEKPGKTILSKNPKGLKALKKNWKNKHTKMKMKLKKRGKKKHKHDDAAIISD